MPCLLCIFFFSSRRRHTRFKCDWSSDVCASDLDELVPSVHGVLELPDLLPYHDVVIVIVPLGENTARMVDDAFLAAMPDGSLLVNVSRGAVVDTEALLRHTLAGRVRAALD